MASCNANWSVAAMLLMTIGARAQGVVATPVGSDLTFRLGPDDVIAIRAIEAEEISDKQIRIGADGYINLPTVGRLKAAGLTVEEVQAEIVNRLKRWVVNPDVSVTLMETKSQPVTVMGAVKAPGVLQLQGRKTLVEVLSQAGGPRDDAGYTVTIMRKKESGPLPLPGAREDSTGIYTAADVSLEAVMDARDPAANIQILPNDVISVPKAEMVYVIGEVLKPGGIALGDQKTVTALQAVSIANGLSKTAKATEAKILRLTPGSLTRSELPVNLKQMLAGKTGDVQLQADDILYVPNSVRKDLGMKTLEALAGTGTTGAIYRIP